MIFMKGKNDLKSDVDFLSSYVAEVVYEGTAHFPEVGQNSRKEKSFRDDYDLVFHVFH